MTVLISLFLLIASRLAVSLRVTPGSPCAKTCGGKNTTSSDIVCYDKAFSKNSTGSHFKDCVSCELQSDFHHTGTQESDVRWGLYNLRFAFSSCVYSYPHQIRALSSPCEVTCDPLRDAVTYALTDPQPSGVNAYDFCGFGAFSDGSVSDCVQCWGWTDREKYMANFLEAVREGCHPRSASLGSKFKIAPSRIFNTTTLPAVTTGVDDAQRSSSSGVPKSTIGLAVAFSVVSVWLILLLITVGCCWRYGRNKDEDGEGDGIEQGAGGLGLQGEMMSGPISPLKDTRGVPLNWLPPPQMMEEEEREREQVHEPELAQDK
ncbi:hypothetical protein KEM55_002939 [Ascosphaera atra]|nr:hypothetical protein KEM55_002939 [Ascosphaera atra]